MSESSKVPGSRILQKRKAQFLRQAEEQFDRDMQTLDELTARYGLHVSEVGDAEPPTKPNGSADKARTVQGSVSSVVIQKAQEFLRQRGTRAQSGEIAKALVAQGVALGDDAGKKVSSYLTRSTLFDNKPNFGGYGLAEWNGAERAPTKHRLI